MSSTIPVANAFQYPAHYNYNTNVNPQLGSPFQLAAYTGQNWSFDGSPYNMPSQNAPTTGNSNPRGSMSAPQTPARRQSMAMATNFDTPPYTRNNSTVTLESNNSSSHSFETPTHPRSQAQNYAAVTPAIGVPTTGASNIADWITAPITQAPSLSQATASSAPSFDPIGDVFVPSFDLGDDEDFKWFTGAGTGGDENVA